MSGSRYFASARRSSLRRRAMMVNAWVGLASILGFDVEVISSSFAKATNPPDALPVQLSNSSGVSMD